MPRSKGHATGYPICDIDSTERERNELELEERRKQLQQELEETKKQLQQQLEEMRKRFQQ